LTSARRVYYLFVAAKVVETISLDTQVFVATSFGFSGKSFQALKKHLESGRLNLVMTDITVREVKSRIKQSVAAELINQKTYVNGASALFNASLPEVLAGLNKVDPDVVTKDLCDQFDAFLAEVKATVIETADLSVGDVLDKYFASQPPFGDGEKKKYEFPDAFAVQALAEWAEDHDVPMFVVSRDNLFQQACGACSHLIPKTTINEVLDHVASDDEQLAAFVRTETVKRIDSIAKEAKADFEDRHYWVEDEDGDAEVEVTDLTPAIEPEIIELDKNEAVLQLSISAEYKADLSYNDSATASYSEGELVYVERRDEQIEDKQELTVQIEVMFEDMDPGSFEILGVSVIEPSDGFGIETQNARDWPYK
jgi:hypothetical protein